MPSSSEIEIMFSYLILIGFITVIFAVSGQTIFGSEFPINPLTTTSFALDIDCSEYSEGSIPYYGCYAGGFFVGSVKLISVPFLVLSYVFSIFIFFMTSSTLWWLGAIVFIPAGVVFLFLIYPILEKLLEILVGILRAIAEAIPF